MAMLISCLHDDADGDSKDNMMVQLQLIFLLAQPQSNYRWWFNCKTCKKLYDVGKGSESPKSG